jgi:hypothetical protein
MSKKRKERRKIEGKWKVRRRVECIPNHGKSDRKGEGGKNMAFHGRGKNFFLEGKRREIQFRD